MKLAIQTITSSWSKKSRGFPLAKIRNSIPDKLELPDMDFNDHSIGLLHNAYFKEHNNFDRDEKYEIKKIENEIKTGCIELLRSSDKSFEVYYLHNTEIAGAPARNHSFHRKFLKTLNCDTWIQVKYNGRFSYEDGWYYRQFCHNITLGNIPKNVFLMNKPTYIYNDVVKLY